MTSSYRTVSKITILVISDGIPIGLKACEQKRVCETENVKGETVNVDDGRKRTIKHWQQKCNTETSGRWAVKLLLYITRWMERKFGEINHYLTQLLSGHGNFCKRLLKMGKMTRPNCICGDGSFDCEKYGLKKRNLEATVGACTIENFCDIILSSEENWNNKANYSEDLLKSKIFNLEN